MKNSKLIIGASAFVLAIGGFVVTKANNYKTNLTKVFVKLNSTSGNAGATITISGSHFTTVKTLGSSSTVIMRTVGGLQIGTVYTSSAASNKAYFKG